MLTDLPGRVIESAVQAGLEPAGRHVALICGLRGDHLINRASFFAMYETRRSRTAGLPAHVVAHEDLLIFRRPVLPGSPRELKDPQRELVCPEQRFSHVGLGDADEVGAAEGLVWPAGGAARQSRVRCRVR